jgi:hypothetical protein
MKASNSCMFEKWAESLFWDSAFLFVSIEGGAKWGKNY